jgi:hypothetical protein
MDWTQFVTFVSPTRLFALGIALIVYLALGLIGAIKAGEFKWAKIADFLKPAGNFLGMIVGYVAIAFLAAGVDTSFEPLVIGSYVFIVAAMVAKIKDQLAYLGLPLAGFKLPLEKPPTEV